MFKRKPNFEEVASYVRDIEEMTNLRDRLLVSGVADQIRFKEEINRYDTAIECMQLVLIRLLR